MRNEYLFMWIYKGEPGCLSSISVSFTATREPRLSVTDLQMEKRKTHPPVHPPSSESSRNLQCAEAIEQARGPVLTLIWIERLSWSILHGPLALRTNSPRAIWPRGNEILSSPGGSTAAWGPHTRPLAHSDGKWWGLCMRVQCETVDTIARCFSAFVVLGWIHKSNAVSHLYILLQVITS